MYGCALHLVVTRFNLFRRKVMRRFGSRRRWLSRVGRQFGLRGSWLIVLRFVGRFGMKVAMSWPVCVCVRCPRMVCLGGM